MLVNTYIAYIQNKEQYKIMKNSACQWISVWALWNLIPDMLANAYTLIVLILCFKVQLV
jgi:hypothetical protein